MAVTKIKAIRGTLSKALAYIMNPEKTDDKMLVSSYGCATETAAQEFEWTRKIAEQQGMNPVKIIARHVIQSFDVGERAQFLSKIYMPEQSKKWREFLIGFAKKIGKPDPETYVDSGKWKARQGGNGLASANDVKIRFTNCTAEDHAKIYRLVRAFDDELVGMFVPFGRVAPELGKRLLREVIVLDHRTNVPILSLQPFNQDGYDYAVKVRTMNVADHDELQRMVGYSLWVLLVFFSSRM